MKIEAPLDEETCLKKCCCTFDKDFCQSYVEIYPHCPSGKDVVITFGPFPEITNKPQFFCPFTQWRVKECVEIFTLAIWLDGHIKQS